MSVSFPSAATSPIRRVLGRLILLGCLVQILLFYVGFLQTERRIEPLWGKSLEERRALVGQPWHVFKSFADRFPQDARIYLIYPEQHVHDVVNYYFYPRLISVSTTNTPYRIPEEYDKWAEVPDEQWLIANRYTHVLTFKDEARSWVVQPGVGREIAEWEKSHANNRPANR